MTDRTGTAHDPKAAPGEVTWTLVSRPARGRYFRPVAGVAAGLSWWGARYVADAMGAAGLIPAGADVWFVPTQGSDQHPDDRDNVMLASGKRLPIRWDARADLYAPAWLADGTVSGDDVLSGAVRDTPAWIEYVVRNTVTVPEGIVTEDETEHVAPALAVTPSTVAAAVCENIRREVIADATSWGVKDAAGSADYCATTAGLFWESHDSGKRARWTYRALLWTALDRITPIPAARVAA